MACASLATVVILILRSPTPDPTISGPSSSPSRSQPHSQADPSSSRLVAGHPSHRIPLPDFLLEADWNEEQIAPHLSLTLTRRSQCENGSLALEGTLSAPAPGHFIFCRQPSGQLPGLFAGVIYFPSLDYGYRLATFNEQPVLIRQSAEAIACLNYHSPEEDAEVSEIPADHPTAIPIPIYQNGVLPLQSLPGATGALYLDFDGEDGDHQGWGDFDAATYGFSNDKIREIWARVAEDFAPFTLNVTTDLQIFLNAPETSRQRCIITPTKEAAPDAGGVAYVGSFNWAGDTPCWSFLSGTKSCAEVISHEFGHTLGLGHDGRTNPSETYYGGHGNDDTGWAPIMGVSHNKNLSHWCKGDYLESNNPQDDLAEIAQSNNSVALRPDDHEDNAAEATALAFTSSGVVDDEGIIETDEDLDVFSFTTTATGTLNLSIDPVAQGPNLDLVARLYDSSDALLETSNPTDLLGATLSSTLAAGDYTIRITNVGLGDPLGAGDGYLSYASLGQYTITGTIPSPLLPDFFEIAENSALAAPVGTVTPHLNHDGNQLTWSITAGNELGAFGISQSGEITVASPAILDVESLSAGWHDPPFFNLTVTLTDTIDSNLDESLSVVITVLDRNEAPTIEDAAITILEHTLVARPLLKLSASDPDEFDLLNLGITAGDPDGRFAVDQSGTLTATSDLSALDRASYSLTITATDSGTPALTDSATVQITVIDTEEGYNPGQVEHTIYRQVPGNALTNLTSDPNFPNCPHGAELRPEVHARDEGNNYGRVVRAYFIPPTSGFYTFWIAGDDHCQLDLSTDALSANASTIASFAGYTSYQQWDKFSGQKSALLSLVAGQAYYLEARQKEGGGNDHLSLAWEVRDGSLNIIVPREPLPGLFLAPHLRNYCPQVTDVNTTLRSDALPGTLIHHYQASDLNAADSHSFTILTGNESGAFHLDLLSGLLSLTDASALDLNHPLTIRLTDDGTPALSSEATITIDILAADAISTPDPLMEFWDGLSGNSLSTLTSSPQFPDRPDRLLELSDFDSGEKLADDYGARIRAYLIPPLSGAFTFYLASDDQGALFLSTDNDPANAVQICGLSAWTSPQEWDKYPAEQTSDSITLVAGQRYFIEARVKEGGGGDHVAVAWTGPAIGIITVIADRFLEPFDSNVAPHLCPQNSVVDLAAAPSPGQSVATFSATDSPFESITYAILSGNHNQAFAIEPQTGSLTVADPTAFHSGPYQLTIAAQDSGHGGYFPLRTATTTLTLHLDDSDRDRLPDSWELAKLGDLAQTDSDDFDNDQLSNYGEFLFGTIPTSRQSFPRPSATGDYTATTARFQFRVRRDAPPNSYNLSHSSDYVSWNTLALPQVTTISSTPLDADHDLLTIEIPATSSHCFLRLAVP